MSGTVAVFVDGDNLSAEFAGRIIRAAEKLGSVRLAKVYGNSQTLAAWSEAFSFQRVFSGDGKNAADLHLAIEATEYLVAYKVQTLVLCSSDADFVHLARFARARGIHVVGMGEEKTKHELRKACSDFKMLAFDSPAKSALALSDMDRQVVQIIRASTGSMLVTKVNPEIRNKFGTRISDTEHKNWRTYFSSRPDLYKLDEKGRDARVYLRTHSVS